LAFVIALDPERLDRVLGGVSSVLLPANGDEEGPRDDLRLPVYTTSVSN